MDQNKLLKTHRLCIRAFSDLLKEMDNAKRDFSGQVSKRDWVIELERYTIIVNNIVVDYEKYTKEKFKSAPVPNAPFIELQLISVLKSILNQIHKVIQLLRGDRIPLEEQLQKNSSDRFQIQEPPQDDPDESPWEFSSDDGCSKEDALEPTRDAKDDQSEQPNSEMRQIRDSIKETITSLSSFWNRKPLSERTFPEALLPPEELVGPEREYIIDVMKMFPKLSLEVATRLGKSNLRRRNTINRTEARRLLQNNSHWDIMYQRPAHPKLTVQPKPIKNTSSWRESVPRRPRGGDGRNLKAFICRYCDNFIRVHSFVAWRTHILEDIFAWVCTYPDCPIKDNIYEYSEKNKWEQHELSVHRFDWSCNTEGHETYVYEKALLTHLAEDHKDASIEGLDPQDIKRLFAKPATTSFRGMCTLCMQYSNSIGGHTSEHLETLALAALPPEDYLDNQGKDYTIDSDYEDYLEDSDEGSSVEHDYQGRLRGPDGEFTVDSEPLSRQSSDRERSYLRYIKREKWRYKITKINPSDAAVTLRRWLRENCHYPYPTKKQVIQLAKDTKLTAELINNWFTNARRQIYDKTHGRIRARVICVIERSSEASSGTSKENDSSESSPMTQKESSRLRFSDIEDDIALDTDMIEITLLGEFNERKLKVEPAAKIGVVKDMIYNQLKNIHGESADLEISLFWDGKKLDEELTIEDTGIKKNSRISVGRAIAEEDISFIEDNGLELWIINPPRVLYTHTDMVTSVAFPPDDKTVASASNDKTVRLWDMRTGAKLDTLHGHTDRVTSVAFSPDDKTVASASNDKTVRLWDICTGAKLNTLHGHTDTVTSVVFSPDGKTVASASNDKTVRLWDTRTGAELNTLHGHTDMVTSVVFSPDGRTVASASNDKTVRLWYTRRGAELNTLHGHTDMVTSVAFSPNGNIVASASNDKTVRLWYIGIGVELDILRGHTDTVTSVVFSPDGNIVASASNDKTVRLWETRIGAKLNTLHGHTDTVTSVVFSPDGKTVASTSNDKTVRLWDIRTGAELDILRGHTDRVTSVIFSPDGKVVASASNDLTVRLWDAASGRALTTLYDTTDTVTSVTTE